MSEPKFSYTRTAKDDIVVYRFKNVENHRGEVFKTGVAHVEARHDSRFNPCMGFKSLQNMFVAIYVRLGEKTVKDYRAALRNARRVVSG